MKQTSLLLLLLLSLCTYAQKATITGYVEDASSGEKMIGATIYDAKTLKGTSSNTYGFYSLTLDTGEVELVISFVGFTSYTEKFHLTEDKFQNASLAIGTKLDEFEVSAVSSEKVHEKSQMSTIQIPMKQIEKLPAFMGEKDIIKAIQLLPGVQSGSEGSSGLYVRGGGPDQNLILLDGVPVYNASHLFGFFSVFNASAINSVEIIKGGFPARFGGRASSVLDIRMKEGNIKKFAGEASIGLISSKLMLEGPIWKDKTSFVVSGRRTYIDILAKPFIPAPKGGNGVSDAGYYFYDLNAKVNHKFDDKHRLFLSMYMGNDKAYSDMQNTFTQDSATSVNTSTATLQWGNITTALRYNQIINKKLFMNITGTFSRYLFLIGSGSATETTTPNADPTTESNGFDYTSGIYDWGGKVDFDYLPSPNHYVRFGLNETYHTFTPGVNTFVLQSNSESIDTTFGASAIYSHEMSAYIEDDIKIGARIKLNPGVRYSAFLVSDTMYQNFEPRFSSNFLVTENFSVKASYARMAQYLHLLTNGTIGLPTDLWVPVTDSIRPIISDQVALGVAYTYKNKYEFSVEGYYKKMQNLIEYKDGASFFGDSENWDKKVEMGTGTSYGMEFLAQKKVGRTSGWIGYTLSWSNRLFDNLNFGREYSYKYDRRHDIGIALIHELKKRYGEKAWKIDLGLTWVYGTGNAISLPISTYRAYDANAFNMGEKGAYSEINNYENRNDFREPSYHRMDLSITFTKTKAKYESAWNLSVYNAYNRMNPFYLYFAYNAQNKRVLNQVSLFPILPSVNYSIKF